MSAKFFYLYLIGGIVASLLLIYQVIVTYPEISISGVLFNLVPIVFLFYMATRVQREKKDQELM